RTLGGRDIYDDTVEEDSNILAEFDYMVMLERRSSIWDNSSDEDSSSDDGSDSSGLDSGMDEDSDEGQRFEGLYLTHEIQNDEVEEGKEPNSESSASDGGQVVGG
ncbi:hypothetical protein HDV05_001832, partial [Chytridiales sp. JEL 0842]